MFRVRGRVQRGRTADAGCPAPGFSDLGYHEPSTSMSFLHGAVEEIDLGPALAAGAHKSHWVWKSIHSAGLVPSASERRSDISAEMPALQFRMRESVTREPRRCLLDLHLAQPLPQHASRMRRIEHLRHGCPYLNEGYSPCRSQNTAGVTMGYRPLSASRSLSPVIR